MTMYCMDSSVLLHLMEQKRETILKTDGTPIEFSVEILEHFVSQSDHDIMIPTPALAEILTASTSDQKEKVEEYIARNDQFIIAPYDQRIARMHARIEREEIARRGNSRKMVEGSKPWQRVKLDRQILAVAAFHECSGIVTTDKQMKKDANRYNLEVLEIEDLDIPDYIVQQRLDLDEPQESGDSKVTPIRRK